MRVFVITLAFICVVLIAFGARLFILPEVTPVAKYPERIITLSPSATEAVYFLGEWDKVIAVSRYCVFPPEAAEKPKVGGIEDINYEAVVAMKPDLVILSHMQEEAGERLRNLGVNTLLVQQATLEDMISSLGIIGTALGAEDKAESLTTDIEDTIAELSNRAKSHERRAVLFVVSRDIGGGNISNVIAAANDGYYSSILELLNASNPFENYASYASISKEGIYRINPDVIIELLYQPEQADTAAADWQSMPEIKAVQSGRICSIAESYGYIPGPRLGLLAKEMADCIYPEEAE